MRSARPPGVDTDAVEYVASDNEGRIDIGRLRLALHRCARNPVIVCLQASNLHSGSFDEFTKACAISLRECLGSYRRCIRAVGSYK